MRRQGILSRRRLPHGELGYEFPERMAVLTIKEELPFIQQENHDRASGRFGRFPDCVTPRALFDLVQKQIEDSSLVRFWLRIIL